jgi:type IV secretory pathway VirB10-like protein
MMKNSDKDSIEIRLKKPSVVQLNKTLIISLIGILVLVLILIIVNSYTRQNRDESRLTSKASRELRVPPATTQPDHHLLSNFPEGYEDSSKVDEVLKRSLSNENQVDPAVESELSALKIQQAQLTHELSVLQAQKSSQEAVEVNAGLSTEASRSSIFFAGSAPISKDPNTNGGTESSDKLKANANDKETSKGRMEYPSEYQSQNMQGQKMDFLNAKPSADIYNQNGVQYPVSKFIVQAGTVIPAILQTQVVSSLPGMITAIASQNVYDSITGQYLIIPKGSKLLGQYNSQISYGQSELQAKFVRIIRPDGSSVTLSDGSAGVDQKGVSGFSDTVDNHWGSVIGSAALMTVFNIPAIVATNQMNNNCVDNGYNGCTTSMGSTVAASSLQSVGQSASQVGSSIANKSLNIQPTITIHPGYQFSIMVTKDTILPPYHTPMQIIPEISEK